MEKRTVFIADDYKLTEVLDRIAAQLEQRGIRVIRGPKTVPGIRLEYPDDQLEALFGDADVAMFSSRSICDERVLRAGRKLRGIVNPTIGLDTVDTKRAGEMGIIIANGAIPENYIGMAESNVLLALMLFYQPMKTMDVMTGKRREPALMEHWARMVCEKTIGVVGFGRIGRSVAERFSTWNANILAYDPYLTAKDVPEYVTLVGLDELYARSDIIDVQLIVTDETRGMIDRSAFEKMKPGVCFINTSRGQVVDEAALVEALRSGKVAGAALDTFQIEPLPKDSPLRSMDNVILTPHLVGHTLECQLRFIDAAVANITAILEGELPPYCANRSIEAKWKQRLEQLA